MYVLRLAADGRILEVMDLRYKTETTPVVDTYPDGILYHYKYVDGKYIYDPPADSGTGEAGGDAPTLDGDGNNDAIWDEIAAAIREGVNSV